MLELQIIMTGLLMKVTHQCHQSKGKIKSLLLQSLLNLESKIASCMNEFSSHKHNARAVVRAQASE